MLIDSTGESGRTVQFGENVFSFLCLFNGKLFGGIKANLHQTILI